MAAAAPLPLARPPLLKSVRRPSRTHGGAATPGAGPDEAHQPTPTKKVIQEVVSYNRCRPFPREKKISAATAAGDDAGAAARGGILKSVFSSFTWGSPHFSSCSAASSYASSAREEEWKLAATQLSYKLLQAIRKRDEAISEASRLKLSVSELEKKLTRLENYSHDLKSTLEQHQPPPPATAPSPPKSASRGTAPPAAPTWKRSSAGLSTGTSSPPDSSAAAPPACSTRPGGGGQHGRLRGPPGGLVGGRAHPGDQALQRGFSRFCDAKMGEVGGSARRVAGAPAGMVQPPAGAHLARGEGRALRRRVYGGASGGRRRRAAGGGDGEDDGGAGVLRAQRRGQVPGDCSSAGERRKIAGAHAGVVLRKSEEETVDRSRRR
ncbi:unnamed protein product [Spirodela intermedia]|uniref:Uncharacterized protein n=1 Tax=Spirodela intermedia TaxID=51605 RepID=A0A7I8JTS8_SPIIN|nr:unnamed protein product [Spirodela intermedia]CAA6673597.1 unnamed protein product [Spirodela intermedia]